MSQFMADNQIVYNAGHLSRAFEIILFLFQLLRVVGVTSIQTTYHAGSTIECGRGWSIQVVLSVPQCVVGIGLCNAKTTIVSGA